jgi:hypothetical protein
MRSESVLCIADATSGGLAVQVADLHRLVERQTALTLQATAPLAVAGQQQQQACIVTKGSRPESNGDPRTVLVSSLGGGSGSLPSSLGPSGNQSSAVRTAPV